VFFDLKYGSVEEAAEAFKLPKTPLAPGTTFTNAQPLRVQQVTGWRDHVLGFVSEKAIWVICYKSNAGRMEAGFHFDGTWLNRGLLQADGETLVAPPPEKP
jgi:hypothetical protein